MKLYNFDTKKPYQHCIYKHPFRIFYNINGDDKTPEKLEYNLHVDIPDYILNLINAFSEAYNIYIDTCKLVSPLKAGIYYDKGASFIDILIVNIPVQKGLVAAELIDNSDYFIGKDNMYGESIKIQLDKNLIKNTATPIHELFHVFQYNYTNFNNMWFMEGLARWSQNFTHTRKMLQESLPQTVEELDLLLNRAHDAEYFWRKLISLIDSNENFILMLLEELLEEQKKLEENHININKFNKENWTKLEKKDKNNNKYIFSAIINTINKIQYKENQELSGFLSLISKHSTSNHKLYNTPKLQRFLKILQKCDKNLVLENEKILYCENFNLVTKTLTTPLLNCDNLFEDELDALNQIIYLDGVLELRGKNITNLHSFNYLKSVKKLVIKDMKNLQAINGFNSLENLHSLEISNNQELNSIDGFSILFKNNHKIDGSIKCFKNKNLKSINFLKGVKEIGSSFYLYQNDIKNLQGLENLSLVKASVTFASNKLESLEELSTLTKIDGILNVANNNLKTLKGLQNLSSLKTLRWNGEYRTLSIEQNRGLYDISAIKNIVVSDRFIFYIDLNTQYKSKPKENTPFYRNNLTIYELQNKKELSVDLFQKNMYVEIPKILFGDKWQSATAKCLWMEAHHINFGDINKVIQYAKKNNIKFLFANNYKTQMAITNNQALLKQHGLEFIVNHKITLKNLVDKQLFYDILLMKNLQEYVPTYYERKKDVIYPCMVKIKSGGAGRGMFIANNEDDLKDATEDMIMSEYLTSNVEYASSIFTKNSKIIKHITYSKTSDKELYILQHESKNSIKVEKTPTQFLDIFEKILSALNPSKEYCQCSINFKIQNGIPKIFEINPRIGYTLAGFPDDFKKMMDLYMKEMEK